MNSAYFVACACGGRLRWSPVDHESYSAVVMQFGTCRSCGRSYRRTVEGQCVHWAVSARGRWYRVRPCVEVEDGVEIASDWQY